MNSELDALERDVDEARHRVQDDLANLRGPAVVSLKRDLTDSADSIVADIKDRLAANPIATLAIGAGVAWKLAHRPPVASLLVGYGIYSLMRTDPRRPSPMNQYAIQAVQAGEAIADRAAQFAGDAKAATAEGLRAAQEAAAQAADRIKSTASDWSDRAAQFAGEATTAAAEGLRATQEAAAQTADRARSTANEWTGRAAQASEAAAEALAQRAASLRESAPQAVNAVQQAVQRDRDTYLLGFAAAALAAAIGISAQRRAR